MHTVGSVRAGLPDIPRSRISRAAVTKWIQAKVAGIVDQLAVVSGAARATAFVRRPNDSRCPCGCSAASGTAAEMIARAGKAACGRCAVISVTGGAQHHAGIVDGQVALRRRGSSCHSGKPAVGIRSSRAKGRASRR